MQLAGAGRDTIPTRTAPPVASEPAPDTAHAVAGNGGQATRGQRLQFRAFVAAEALAARLSPRAAKRVAAAIGGAAVTLAPRRFDGLRANLRRVLPDASDAELHRVLRANVGNLGRAWAEVMSMPSHGDELAARVYPINVENMLGPQKRGRGVVIASLHLGSWEVGLACWNSRFGSMAVLAEVLRPPEFFEHVVAGRQKLGIQVIPIDTAGMREADPAAARRLGAAAVRDVIRTLRRNGLVAMAMDRDLIGNGQPLDFFGAPARIPLGVVDIAIRTGAAIVPIVLLRAGDDVIAPCFPEITYHPEAPREAEIRRVASEVLRVFESVIREHPDQWHVLDPIWDSAEAAA